MEKEKFEQIVTSAIQKIPQKIRKLLENVEILIEDWPTKEHLKTVGKTDKFSLLGLYQGIPKTKRGVGYANVLPDRITLFQKPIENIARNEKEIKKIVMKVIIHEIAHHLGFDEKQAKFLEKKSDKISID